MSKQKKGSEKDSEVKKEATEVIEETGNTTEKPETTAENPAQDHKHKGDKTPPAKAEPAGDPTNEELAKLTETHLRTLAEFDNFRKRTQKEKEQIYKIAENDAIRRILPILDNLDRGRLASTADENVSKGMEMIYTQCLETLSKMGVEEIDAKGKLFDPLLHNAVMHTEDPDFEENTVAEVLQKGYQKEGEILRHATVKVAN